jgi:ubiquinone/menaquinone biosynthesis C-methylase UbiE
MTNPSVGQKQNVTVSDVYLTKEQQSAIDSIHLERWDDNIPGMSSKDAKRWHIYKDYHHELLVWHKFFENVFHERKNEAVLDFGAGSAWSCVVGKSLGFKEIRGVDINTQEVLDCFPLFHKENGATVDFWDGKKMPYEDNSYESIISKSALTKLKKTDYDVLIDELVRISKPGAEWYISPPYMVGRSLNSMSVDRVKKIAEKEIQIIAWDYPREEHRFAEEELADPGFMDFVQEMRNQVCFSLGKAEISVQNIT